MSSLVWVVMIDSHPILNISFLLPKAIMDAIKAAGWTRFKPVKGQPIAEQDMIRVFRIVDMDKSGAISQLV